MKFEVHCGLVLLVMTVTSFPFCLYAVSPYVSPIDPEEVSGTLAMAGPQGRLSIMSRLDPAEALLEYHLNDSVLLILSVTRDSVILVARSVDPVFWQCLNAFRRKLRVADCAGINQLARSLYDVLVFPVEQYLDGRTRLIIVPDGRLDGVPFEAFARASRSMGIGEKGKIRYLIQDYEVTYRCSSSLWVKRIGPKKQQRAESRQRPVDFSGFAPGSWQNRGIVALPETKRELEAIHALFQENGRSSYISLGDESHEAAFRDMASRATILHVATHSNRMREKRGQSGMLFWDYNPDEGGCGDNDGVLTPPEILEMHLGADLIVLNACASAANCNPESPQGVTLPVLFLSAGAQNVLATFWNIPDRIAGSFMVEFYRLWFEGQSYSTALRTIKLKMLGRPQTTLPTLWAPYVLIGM